MFDRLAARFPVLLLARRNLARSRDLTVLAVLAVVIGVVAIGGIGLGGEAFKQDQLSAFEGFGGTATADPIDYEGEPPSERGFGDDDIDRMRQAAGSATVLPVVSPGGSTVQTASGDIAVTAQVNGIEDPRAFYDAQTGEIPANWRRSVVVGARIADTNDIAVGDRITVSVPGAFTRAFTVDAILEAQGFADPLSADQTVFVPLAQFGEPRYDSAVVRVPTTAGDIDAVAENIEAALNVRRQEVSVSPVQNQRAQFEQLFGTINQFLAGVGALSLLVAAVTIANTQLMSALEREGELGVMRAVGYPKLAVVRLLVAESAALGVVGAAVGIPLALAIGLVVNALLVGDPLAFTATGLTYVAVGAVFGILTALVAGIYPAWRTANKRPVEAFQG
ncbi:ABC transporter permease [Halosegnis longus]|uniref:FtsX-like permease family protein n=1 Tax=Halosegnis longus TaxID=2216012 RepID=A0AAJ4R7P3_9EURY|nr:MULTISPECIES: ABC transporter permease [Halobacteriales]RNJ25697.1 FtsX-like permease family protein [Salella cibi]